MIYYVWGDGSFIEKEKFRYMKYAVAPNLYNAVAPNSYTAVKIPDEVENGTDEFYEYIIKAQKQQKTFR